MTTVTSSPLVELIGAVAILVTLFYVYKYYRWTTRPRKPATEQ